RSRKFCARNRLRVIAGGLVLGSLCAGLVTSSVFYRDAAASSRASVESLDTALQAVAELVQVGDSELVAVPHLEGVRRDLLQRSVSFYRHFLSRSATADPRLLPGILDALVRLGSMQRQLGQIDAAMQSLLEVDKLLATPAATALPTSVRQNAHADALLGRAHTLDRSSKPEAALALLDEAMPIARELAKSPAFDPHAARRLASALTFHANMLIDSEPWRAMSLIDEAATIAQHLQQRQPDDLGALAQLLEIGVDRADMLRKTGRRDECLAATAKLRALRDSHAQRSSWPLVRSMLDIVDILHTVEQPDEALAVIEDSLPFVEKQVADHPAVATYRLALIKLHNARGAAELLRRNFAASLAAQRQVRADCEAALALVPGDLQVLRYVVVDCINTALTYTEWRKLGGPWDEKEVDAVLQRATAVLDSLPKGEPQVTARPQRMEVLGLQGLLRESQGDRAGACTAFQTAIEIADALAAEAPQTIAYRTRLCEMQRRYASLLLDDARAGEALGAIEQAMHLSDGLRDSADAQVRWQTRRRELLLLQVRARGATSDIDGAFASLAEHQTLGNELDWVGRQDAARALMMLVTSLPAADPAKVRFVARARELLDEALAYEPLNLERGTGHGTVAVMRGNTLVVARQLELAANDPPTAAKRAGETVEAYAEAWSSSQNQRNQNRVRDAAAIWLQDLVNIGDEAGISTAFARFEQLFAGRADALADLAGNGAQLAGTAAAPPLAATLRSGAIALLRAASSADLPTAVLHEERFAPLRSEAAFAALTARREASPDKQ
ncbi:MAG: hypothetical protein ABIP94_07120, partial [Planctomycetota bacterium]